MIDWVYCYCCCCCCYCYCCWSSPFNFTTKTKIETRKPTNQLTRFYLLSVELTWLCQYKNIYRNTFVKHNFLYTLLTLFHLLFVSSLNVLSIFFSIDGHRQTTFTSTGWNESGNNIVHHHQQQKQSTLSVDTGQTHYVTQSVLPKAENLSVILTSWYPPAVRVHWRYNFSQIQNSRLKAFQIMYYPSKSRYVLFLFLF